MEIPYAYGGRPQIYEFVFNQIALRQKSVWFLS